MQPKIAIFSLLILIDCTSCQSRNSSSDVKIVNGVVISDSEFPEVTALKSKTGGIYCTGTFVGSNTILTAAHCLAKDPSVNGHSPAFVLAHSLWQGPTMGTDQYDLALLIFDKDIAPKVATLGLTPPSRGQEFTMVGYGCDDWETRSGKGIRRKGKSAITEVVVISSGATMIKYPSAKPGDSLSDACFGDSGGPMMVDGKLIGVTQGAVSKSHSQSIDLSTETSKKFLEQAAANGAKIDSIQSTNGGTDHLQVTRDDRLKNQLRRALENLAIEFKADVMSIAQASFDGLNLTVFTFDRSGALTSMRLGDQLQMEMIRLIRDFKVPRIKPRSGDLGSEDLLGRETKVASFLTELRTQAPNGMYQAAIIGQIAASRGPETIPKFHDVKLKVRLVHADGRYKDYQSEL